MPYVCRDCEHFDPEGASASACSECGGAMRFTMIDPRGEQADDAGSAAEARPAWHDPYQYGYEIIEAPWEFRYAQIGIGISTYFFIWRMSRAMLLFLIGTSIESMPIEKVALILGIGVLVLNCVAAIAGGAAAGFWARNWVVQGLGVACGVLAIPIIGMLIFIPESWPIFFIMLAATSTLTMLGAFLGHLLVGPTKIPIS
jgi:hypothetical protein